MRRVMVLALVALASASCSSAIRWEKPGVGAGEQQRDETECTSRASREVDVPTAQTVGSAASTSTPYDPMRARVQPYVASLFEDCMRTRGYERVPARPPA